MNTGLKPLMNKKDACGPMISVKGDNYMTTKTFDSRNRSCIEQKTTVSRQTDRTAGLLGKSQIDDTASMTHSKMSEGD